MGWLFAAVVFAGQDKPPAAVPRVDCGACHTCLSPSLKDLCLRACTRVVGEDRVTVSAPQGVILLSMLGEVAEGEDRFGPVPFDHSGHAAMADMAGGCDVCHHHTPEGQPHPACRRCHVPVLKRGDMAKPSLKGAYHRQCLNCHREWSHRTDCNVCHLPQVGPMAPEEIAPPTKDDIIGLMHPPIPEPDTEVYQTRLGWLPDSRVIFRHKEHIHRFGLGCAECHHEESCSRCHAEGREHVQQTRSLQEHHRPCSDCHDVISEAACKRCHWRAGEPKPPPFDHASTGWPLNRYHTEMTCRACHRIVPFAKLVRDCNACHEGWDPASFDHSVTGQVLDENHARVACAECHTDRRFEEAPSCDECHDEDEGIAFPARRPGPAEEPGHLDPPKQEANQ
jgi:hypothetical protein